MDVWPQLWAMAFLMKSLEKLQKKSLWPLLLSKVSTNLKSSGMAIYRQRENPYFWPNDTLLSSGWMQPSFSKVIKQTHVFKIKLLGAEVFWIAPEICWFLSTFSIEFAVFHNAKNLILIKYCNVLGCTFISFSCYPYLYTDIPGIFCMFLS